MQELLCVFNSLFFSTRGKRGNIDRFQRMQERPIKILVDSLISLGADIYIMKTKMVFHH